MPLDLAPLIIPEPRERPLWQRLILLSGVLLLAFWKLLHLPKSIWPKPVQSILNNWTWGMFGVVMVSRVQRAYIDQPCVFRQPARLAPKADVAAQYRFSEADLRAFYRNGFIGPFDGLGEQEAQWLGRTLMLARDRPSATYGFKTDRDLHLEVPLMRESMLHPAIIERAAQLLGPDLITWRSQLFHKAAGGAEVQWHQASTYMVEDYLEPALVPPDRNELFQLTIWIALDEVTRANGCLRFIRGSHNRIRTIRFGGERGFYHVNYRLEYDYDPADVVELDMHPGQFVIFSERTVHGSGPNTTDRRRLGMNYRVIPPSVRVYPNKTIHRAMHMGQTYDLSKWGVLLLRGEDKFRLNRYAEFKPLAARS